MKEYIEILKRFDLINLIAIGLVWWNLNAKMETRFSDLDKRLTVIETVLLCNKMMPSHVAAHE